MRGLFWLTIAVVLVHDQLAPRQKQLGRRERRRKAAHCMWSGSREGGEEPGHIPVACLLQPDPTSLITRRLLNLSVDDFTKEYSSTRFSHLPDTGGFGRGHFRFKPECNSVREWLCVPGQAHSANFWGPLEETAHGKRAGRCVG